MKIGILALQGAFLEHQSHLEALGKIAIQIKEPESLYEINGLIIPGGESTTLAAFFSKAPWKSVITKQFYANKLAIWGTCAGAIMLAKTVNGATFPTLALMDIGIERNAYGSQSHSFTTLLTSPKVKAFESENYEAVFIRAPKIDSVGSQVKVMSTLKNEAVAVLQDNVLLATTFHPELTNDLAWHRYFIEMIHYQGN